MTKKSISIIAAVIALSAIMVISAATVYTLNFTSMTANVPYLGDITITIGSTTYSNGQSLPLDWGTVNVGINTMSITIHNLSIAPVTPAIVSGGLPSGWQLTLSSTAAISAGQSSTINIVLTVPSGVAMGSYGPWTAMITASTA